MAKNGEAAVEPDRKMLTTDTITDAEIRKLRARQRRDGNHINVDICNTALGMLHDARGQVADFSDGEIRDARSRCADAINRGE